MLSTKISPPCPIAPAWITNCDASGIIMKYRFISGCVTVTGPPRANLIAEDRYDTAGRVQHVAKPYGDELTSRRWSPGPEHTFPRLACMPPSHWSGLTALSVEIMTNEAT